MSEMEKKRWFCTATYRTENGPIDVDFAVDELMEVHDWIEAGPHWGALDKIVMTYQFSDGELTVEEAEAL